MSNTTISHSLLKFRPVFTLEQIQYITHLCGPIGTTIEQDAEMEQSIRRVLIPMIAKIEVGAINPSYKLSEIHAAKMADAEQRKRYEEDRMSPEEMLEYENKLLGV